MQQESMLVGNNNNTSGVDAARCERILSKFYFQSVLPDQSNVNPESLKTTIAGGNNDELGVRVLAAVASAADIKDGNKEDIESSLSSKNDDNDNKEETEVVASSEQDDSSSNQEESVDENNSNSNNNSTSSIHNNNKAASPQQHHPSLCEVISSWASVGSIPPPSADVCCICLEVYSAGDTICVAKNPNCDHLFHKDCVLEWMKTNDQCPLCRINLLH